MNIPGPRKTNVTKERNILIARLKETIGFVHNCTNINDIEQCGSHLNKINCLLGGNVEREDSLPLRCDFKSRSRSLNKAKTETKTKTSSLTDLPSFRKSKFQYKHRKRVGMKADFMRTNYNCKLSLSNNIVQKAKSLKRKAVPVPVPSDQNQ